MIYLKGKMYNKLVHRKTNKPILLQAYSNANWVGDVATRRSILGYFFHLINVVVSWTSKK
jgi:hypothetical protein